MILTCWLAGQNWDDMFLVPWESKSAKAFMRASFQVRGQSRS